MNPALDASRAKAPKQTKLLNSSAAIAKYSLIFFWLLSPVRDRFAGSPGHLAKRGLRADPAHRIHPECRGSGYYRCGLELSSLGYPWYAR